MARRRKRRMRTLTVAQTGQLAKDITNDLVCGILDLVAVKGKIFIEIDLEVIDNNVFKDDQRRKSKLIINLDLEKA